jgi:hypothetical protein
VPPEGTGVTIYFEEENLDGLYEELVEKGFEFIHGPRDERYL